MIIQCDACQAKFRLDDDKIRGRGARVRCRKCGNTILVIKQAAAAEEPPAPPVSPMGSAAPGKGSFDLAGLLEASLDAKPAAPVPPRAPAPPAPAPPKAPVPQAAGAQEGAAPATAAPQAASIDLARDLESLVNDHFSPAGASSSPPGGGGEDLTRAPLSPPPGEVKAPPPMPWDVPPPAPPPSPRPSPPAPGAGRPEGAATDGERSADPGATIRTEVEGEGEGPSSPAVESSSWLEGTHFAREEEEAPAAEGKAGAPEERQVAAPPPKAAESSSWLEGTSLAGEEERSTAPSAEVAPPRESPLPSARPPAADSALRKDTAGAPTREETEGGNDVFRSMSEEPLVLPGAKGAPSSRPEVPTPAAGMAPPPPAAPPLPSDTARRFAAAEAAALAEAERAARVAPPPVAPPVKGKGAPVPEPSDDFFLNLSLDEGGGAPPPPPSRPHRAEPPPEAGPSAGTDRLSEAAKRFAAAEAAALAAAEPAPRPVAPPPPPAAEMAEPPPRPPAAAREFSPSRPAGKGGTGSRRTALLLVPPIVAALLLAGGGAWVAFTDGGRSFLKAALPRIVSFWSGGRAEPPAELRLRDLSMTALAGPSGERYVIRGEVENAAGGPKSRLQVEATLMDGSGNEKARKRVYAGNTITDEELASATEEEIEQRLVSPLGDGLSNLDVPAGRAIPFTVVFSKVPPGEYTSSVRALQETD